MKDKIIQILNDKKVEDIVSIDLRNQSSIFDFFVIGTVSSSKQVYAIYDEIKKSGIDIHHIEETQDGSWTLIDCYDVVIHLFSQDKREEYNLESLWEKAIKHRESNGS